MQSNPAALWKIGKLRAEAQGERNFEALVSKPKEVNILSPEEAIQRIMSGQQFLPDPLIDAEEYILRIQLFMMTDTFMESDDKMKMDMEYLLKTCMGIRMTQMQARHDAQILQSEAQARAIARNIPAPQIPAGAQPPATVQ